MSRRGGASTRDLIREMSMYHVYFAPRGKERLLLLGDQLSQRHLSYNDRLIGIVGDAGSGKSSIIKGMFPGLELVNDDDGINPLKIMQVRDLDCRFDASTYHIDMRFQMAFTQMHEIVDFVRNALSMNRRVIIEHFDQLYPHLKINADLIVGIGEEIMVTRPNIFGPLPKDIYDIVFKSVKYRRMAHTAEDITTLVLKNEFGQEHNWVNADVRRGFVLEFKQHPNIELDELDKLVHEIIAAGLPVNYYDEEHIKIGDEVLYCSSPRIHLTNTADVEDFHMLHKFIYDEFSDDYSLVGLVGQKRWDIEDLNKLHAF